MPSHNLHFDFQSPFSIFPSILHYLINHSSTTGSALLYCSYSKNKFSLFSLLGLYLFLSRVGISGAIYYNQHTGERAALQDCWLGQYVCTDCSTWSLSPSYGLHRNTRPYFGQLLCVALFRFCVHRFPTISYYVFSRQWISPNLLYYYSNQHNQSPHHGTWPRKTVPTEPFVPWHS